MVRTDKLDGVEVRVIRYILKYPTNTKVAVTAWIDPNRLVPLRRETHMHIEKITTFEIDTDMADLVLAFPDPEGIEEFGEAPAGDRGGKTQER